MKKTILIIGSGGREYSLGKKFLEDARVQKVYFCPGNGATKLIGENIECKNHQEIKQFAQEKNIDLVFIGPEAPLVNGLADELRETGIKVFGPSKNAARLEGSKAFMKDFASRFNIPTASYLQTSDLNEAQNFASFLKPPIVIKADGLCAGKGVVIALNHEEAADTLKEMLIDKEFGEASNCVVIEEFLNGYELSVFALANHQEYILLPPCQDHKRLLSGDEGPNTGGMGAYTPTRMCDKLLLEKITSKIIEPTLKGMEAEGNPFCGVLFAGIMVVDVCGELEPYLLEYNVRFGDPECEVLLPLLKTPLLELVYGVLQGRLNEIKVEFFDEYSLGVVLVSQYYPYRNSDPQVIEIEKFDEKIGHLAFAGVSEKDGKLYSSGGRVIVCVGRGKSLLEAKQNAYLLVQKVHFEGMNYRDDIGYRALNNEF